MRKSHFRKSKSCAQRKHAKLRAAQRYGLYLGKHDFKILIENIKTGENSKVIERQSHRVTTFLIKHGDGWFPVAYDKLREQIITFLPLEYLANIDLPTQNTPALLDKRDRRAEILVQLADYSNTAAIKANSMVKGYLGVIDEGARAPLFSKELSCEKRILSFDVNEIALKLDESVEASVKACNKLLASLSTDEGTVICYAHKKGDPRSYALSHILLFMLRESGSDASMYSLRKPPNDTKYHDHFIGLAGELLGKKQDLKTFSHQLTESWASKEELKFEKKQSFNRKVLDM